MIDRYKTEKIDRIFNEDHKYEKWLEVEKTVAEIQEGVGIIPRGLSRRLAKLKIDPRRVNEIEMKTNHDVIAFLEAVREKAGGAGKWLHFGMTSYDLVDTALSLMIREACAVIDDEMTVLLRVLRTIAHRYRKTPQMGRTHGIFAQPITFGFKAASWYNEVVRSRVRFRAAAGDAAYGKLSGAVGAYTILDPPIEKRVMRKLRLKPEPVATQVIPRDRLAALLSTLILYACALERVATEIRNLARSEIGEVAEPFGQGQKGSSAMPHKQNPVICERVCGLVKVLRGYLIPAFENINLWHERDISNSAAERIIIGDTFHLVHYITIKMIGVLSGIVVHPDRMLDHIKNSQGVYASQFLMNRLIERGMSRRAAYDIIQSLSFRAIREKRGLAEIAKSEPRIKKLLTAREIDAVFDLRWFLRNIRKVVII
jgi:adenylosuccinate lyase